MARKNAFKTFYALSLAWQLGFLIALPIGGFLFLGFLGDAYFHTLPLFLIIGLIAGIGISVYEAYHMFIPLVKNDSKRRPPR